MCEFVCDFKCKCDFCPRSDVCLTSSAQDPHTESSMLHRLPNDINGNDDNDDGNGYIKTFLLMLMTHMKRVPIWGWRWWLLCKQRLLRNKTVGSAEISWQLRPPQLLQKKKSVTWINSPTIFRTLSLQPCLEKSLNIVLENLFLKNSKNFQEYPTISRNLRVSLKIFKRCGEFQRIYLGRYPPWNSQKCLG